MIDTDWFEANSLAIAQRVAHLEKFPDGVIHERPGTMHDLLIRKVGTVLELHFHGGSGREVISDFDFARPLRLVAGFTQAMMLGLLWRPQPERVYVLGFGAGRVPMVLHHHFPDIRVDSTEIDKDVLDVAQQFFGIELNSRLRVAVCDGREYLAERADVQRYDLIMSDAFKGLGYSPHPVATREFYELCKRHLADDGMVIVNLMNSDYLFREKFKTLINCFANVYFHHVREDGTHVLFATDAPRLADHELNDRAKSLEERYKFSFPFLERALDLAHVADSREVQSGLQNASMLTDATLPQSGPPLPDTVVRVGRNDPCPCGSGRKYKKCHGRK